MKLNEIKKYRKENGLDNTMGFSNMSKVQKIKAEGALLTMGDFVLLEEGDYIVYQLTSPDGKKYIGVSKQPENRWANGNGYKSNKELFDDIQKFGWDAFEKDLICVGVSKRDGEGLEGSKIAELQTQIYGYNHNAGGQGGKGLPRIHSEETKKKMKESRAKYLSENTPHKIAIAQVDDEGTVVAEYKSINQASKATGYNQGNISRCVNGLIDSVNGYRFIKIEEVK